jgi:hypothetical protein
MNTVYVKLAGGLGNQLFQIANGYAYSKKHNRVLLLDDTEWAASQGKSPKNYQNTIFKNFKYVSEKITKDSYIEFHEPEFNYNEIPKFDKDICLIGYFQSLKYFETYKDDFISQLELPECNLFKDSVAVHIRRGDYLQHAHIHYVCDTEYFSKNIKEFSEKNINVFTDSLELVQSEFNDHNFRIIQTESELMDLMAMANHTDIICSNSSFSWWASLLGVKKNKIIVPTRWFNNFQNHDDIYRTDFTLSKI